VRALLGVTVGLDGVDDQGATVEPVRHACDLARSDDEWWEFLNKHELTADDENDDEPDE